MGKNLAEGHVEPIPPNEINAAQPGKVWYLPVFPIDNAKKGKIRLVFDSSATHYGVNLNDQLLQGPDYNNALRGVIMRFRMHVVAFMADVEAMYHAFHLTKEDQDYLRFYWFAHNNPSNGLIPHRATVHIFGNRPSPAIAIYGMRHATSHPSAHMYPEAQKFILNSFYVDDGLGSAETPEQAIQILTGACSILERYKIRFQKIVSSSDEVMRAFPPSELAEDTEIVNLDRTPLHRSLSVLWDIKRDLLIIKPDLEEKPFTRRGVLSFVNAIFDPLGVACPVVLRGKLIQRKVMSSQHDEESSNDKDKKAKKAKSIRKREVSSSILDMDDLIQAGCFLEDGVHLSQEGETKLSQRFIRWIRATHILMEGRMD
ncbi:Retrotransposon Pao [Trinorchestia longiramus]|nr:Retrotransposon Pao [Trinorchestia longiramus]